MDPIIIPMGEEYIQSLWQAVDSVAREKKYLAFLQAPPIESTVEFVKNNLSAFVALVENNVVSWCKVLPLNRPVFLMWESLE